MRNEGGSNKVTNWSINWKDISDIVVCSHESIHTGIHTETIYGFIQTIVNMILDQIKDQGELWKKLKIVSYKLYTWSVHSHEIAATYCSLRDLSKDTISDYKSTLNPRYLGYEEMLLSLIDPVILGSYLQYLIGFHIVYISFNIDFHDYVVHAMMDNKYDFNIDRTPNKRLETILSNLNHKDIDELLNYLNSTMFFLKDKFELVGDIDLNDDSFWEAIDVGGIGVYDELNVQIGKEIENFICETLLKKGVELELATTFDLDKSMMKILKLVPNKISKVVQKKIDLSTYEIIGLEEQSIHEKKWNKYINESKISNNPIFDSNQKPKDNMLVFSNFDNWENLNEAAIVHLELNYKDSSNEKFFIIKTEDNSNEVAIGLFPREDFIHTIKKQKRHKVPLKFDAIIYGIHASVIKDNGKTIHKKLKEILSDFKNPQGLFYQTIQDSNNSILYRNDLRDSIVWYMHGDITVWLNYIIAKKDFRVFLMQFADYNPTNLHLLKSDTNRHLETGSAYFGGVVFYSKNFKGTFIRFLNKMAYDRMQVIIYKLIEKDLLLTDNREERSLQEKQTKRVFKVLDSVWTTY